MTVSKLTCAIVASQHTIVRYRALSGELAILASVLVTWLVMRGMRATLG